MLREHSIDCDNICNSVYWAILAKLKLTAVYEYGGYCSKYRNFVAPLSEMWRYSKRSNCTFAIVKSSNISCRTKAQSYKMLFQNLAAAIFLVVSPLLAKALPANAPSTALLSQAEAAKAHNIYLVSCVPRGRNNEDDKPALKDNFTAIAYFKQPLNLTEIDPDSKAPKPDKTALVSQPPEPWEGVKWRVKVWRSKVFSADIAANAATLSKGGIAGTVGLDDESYVCFKDGETSIRVRDDDLRGNCVADYWCAQLSLAKDKDDQS